MCAQVYPAIKHDARLLTEMLRPIRDKDPREDLKTLARMYCTALEMQMRDKQRWVGAAGSWQRWVQLGGVLAAVGAAGWGGAGWGGAAMVCSRVGSWCPCQPEGAWLLGQGREWPPF